MREEALRVSVLNYDGCPMLEIVGEVDILTCPILERALKDVLEENTPILILDFRPTVYLDSQGLKCIIHAHRALVERGGQLWVVTPETNFVARVLEITGVLEMVRICRDPSEIRKIEV